MKNLYIVVSFVVLSSCSMIAGLHAPSNLTMDEVQIEAKEQNINFPIATLDTNFLSFINSIDTNENLNKVLVKDLKQPLQVWYFNSTGMPLSYMVNCYASGFAKLDWNHYGYFDVFPPKTATPYTQQITYPQIAKYFDGTIPNSNKPYTVVVFWNKYWRKQSKILINQVLTNIKQNSKSDSTDLVFVNNDTFSNKLFNYK